jgi:hypothetical protein
MTHRRQMLAVLAGFLLAAAWASGSSAQPASHVVQHQVVIDSTNYQSEQQLLADTQVMVVAKVESVAIDRPAPASQPASLATLRVHDVLRGPAGKQLVVVQPRATRSQVGQVVQVPLQSGKTYLLLLARAPGAKSFFLVGGNAGEFSYNTTTQRFTKIDTSATWEDSDFALSLAKVGAEAFPESTQPSWLTSPGGPPGSQVLSWSSMANDLGLSPTDVTCPTENLCLFAGDVSPQNPGGVVPAVAVSSGPFSPQGSVVGTTTTFPPSSNASWSFVACSGPDLCVLSSPDGIYVTTDPTAAHWTLEVAPSSAYAFGQVSCPTVSFCAVASGSGVLVTRSPSGGSSAWNYIGLGPEGFQAISCPSPELCVAGGSGDATVGGWIETSTDPIAPASWHGGSTPHPSFAQHSGQYSVTGISCPTTAFCVAAVEAGEPLTSTNPAAGVTAWNLATSGSMSNPGFASCTTGGQCSVSGVGSFVAAGGAPGPGITGYPLPGVSCVSVNFCVTVTDEQLAVGTGAG